MIPCDQLHLNKHPAARPGALFLGNEKVWLSLGAEELFGLHEAANDWR